MEAWVRRYESTTGSRRRGERSACWALHPHYYQLTTKKGETPRRALNQCTGRAGVCRSDLMGVCVRYRHFIWPSLFWAISQSHLLRHSFRSSKPVRRGPPLGAPPRRNRVCERIGSVVEIYRDIITIGARRPYSRYPRASSGSLTVASSFSL